MNPVAEDADWSELETYGERLQSALLIMCECLLKQIDGFNSLNSDEIPAHYKAEIVKIYRALQKNESANLNNINIYTQRLTIVNKEIHDQFFKKHIN